MRHLCLRSICALCVLVALATGAQAQSPNKALSQQEQELAGPLERSVVVRAALQRSPALRAADRRASALRLAGDAESRLPSPEAEVQLWQVPLSRPYAVADATMLMVGVKQPIPAPGSLSARAQARTQEAEVEEAQKDERVREISREVDHALVDYAESAEKQAIHQQHKTASDQILAVARARYVAGGALTEGTQAEVESARIEADIAQEQAKTIAARARLNGLLLRPADAPLGVPSPLPWLQPAEPVAALLAQARALRPEFRTARARQASRLAEVRIAEREASWPMLAVGAVYFAPTNSMPSHGYGLSVSSSIPWLWGKASAEARAGRESALAVRDELAELEARIAAEVATQHALVLAAARKVQVLRARSLPAGQRAWLAAASGYDSGKTDIVTLLTARKAVVEIEVDLVEARAQLAQALVELDWAVGRPVQRAPLADAP